PLLKVASDSRKFACRSLLGTTVRFFMPCLLGDGTSASSPLRLLDAFFEHLASGALAAAQGACDGPRFVDVGRLAREEKRVLDRFGQPLEDTLFFAGEATDIDEA